MRTIAFSLKFNFGFSSLSVLMCIHSHALQMRNSLLIAKLSIYNIKSHGSCTQKQSPWIRFVYPVQFEFTVGGFSITNFKWSKNFTRFMDYCSPVHIILSFDLAKCQMSKRLMTIDDCVHFYQPISINYNAQQLLFYSLNQMVEWKQEWKLVSTL